MANQFHRYLVMVCVTAALFFPPHPSAAQALTPEEQAELDYNCRMADQFEADRLIAQGLTRLAQECYYGCLARQGALCGGYEEDVQAEIEADCRESCGMSY